MSPAGKIRFGILGTASIARRLIGGEFVHATLDAVASRDVHRATAFADEANIPKRYSSYEDLLEDPGIDAVYVPLPQHLHLHYTLKAAEAGKHVFVEKPAALNASQAERMADACRRHGVLFMEGLMYRYRSVHKRAKELATDGTIGALRQIVFAWSHNIMHRGHGGFRLHPETGGALLDLGIYGVDWVRFITETKPALLHACIQRGDDGIDLFTHATLAAGDVLATMTCGYTTDLNYYYVSGEKGSIYAPVSLSGRVLPSTLHIHLLGSDKRYTETFPAENAYVMELDDFALCIKESREPELNADNAITNLTLLDEIRDKGIPFPPHTS